MKKKSVIFILIFILMVLGSITAAEKNLGLGVSLGEPTGITGKLFISDNSAVDATLSWSFIKDKLYVHSDYLHHFYGIFGADFPSLIAYTGIGGMIELKENPEIGVRVPFGLSYTFPNTPIEVFFELGPVVLLAPETSGDLTGGVGARYYFY